MKKFIIPVLLILVGYAIYRIAGDMAGRYFSVFMFGCYCAWIKDEHSRCGSWSKAFRYVWRENLWHPESRWSFVVVILVICTAWL